MRGWNRTRGTLLGAGYFLRTLTERQGLKVGSPYEIAFRLGWIGEPQIAERARLFEKNECGRYLADVAAEHLAK